VDVAKALRTLLKRDDSYEKAGKPTCAWDDKEAREELVDALTRDAFALLLKLDGETLTPEVTKAVTLLATVVGQDIEAGADGVFRILRGVAKDRVISTVDPEARHGHKTEAHSFDGYKAHIAVDAESEIITATDVTAGNAGDADSAEVLLADMLKPADVAVQTGENDPEGKPEVYGDASYGTADVLEKLEGAGIEPYVKVQPPSARKGMLSQDVFQIDTERGEVMCPVGVRVSLRMQKDGSGQAQFREACAQCPLKAQCTTSKTGRAINVHAKHDIINKHRKHQRRDEWKKTYRAQRPKVERKIAHLMRRRHGGRRARVRGRDRVKQDFTMLAASVNLARLAALGVHIVIHRVAA